MLPQLSLRNSAAQLDRVPVFLVHVIAGLDFLVAIAQIERAIRIAFQVHPGRNLVERGEGEHFPTDFEDERVRAEGRAFGDVWFRQAISPEVGKIRHPERSRGILSRSVGGCSMGPSAALGMTS